MNANFNSKAKNFKEEKKNAHKKEKNENIEWQKITNDGCAVDRHEYNEST